ncbi:MAG TPA: group II intron reverse transcriptase/maturase [Woeseiaceae bacterium]|nr:group II intron reverse transcriptase/maturase [Woeseiaceae bacterium]
MTTLMEAVVERENLWRAYARVMRNKGAAGVDAMPVADLKTHLQVNWPRIREELLAGRYEPSAVRTVSIPKPGGKGARLLGIPTVTDRLIQQALHQVLSPIFDRTFSESSFGFRPGHHARQAVQQARRYVSEGRRWAVDLDLEKFFDRVNHDILMSRVARRVKDRRVLRLIRKFLEAGMMSGGVVEARRQGTPQGGPLSPLLSNILLDDLDRELERRGHCFCRYADDCTIYVRTKQSGERVMASVERFLEHRLKLRLNTAKSVVARPWQRTFLGYSMTFHRTPRLRVPADVVQRFRSGLRGVFRRGRGRSLSAVIAELTPILRGWMNYFCDIEAKGVLEALDGWLRRKLRVLLWRQWKRPYTRACNLMRRGMTAVRAWTSATNGRGSWWNAGASHMNQSFPKSFFDRLGLVSLLDHHHHLQRAS